MKNTRHIVNGADKPVPSDLAISALNFDSKRNRTGTREWSDHSFNCAVGCRHNCWYCYARGLARRFGRIDSLAAWEKMEVNAEKVRASARHFAGVVMFPTTHDLTPEILPAALTVLRNLLAADNQVLIVSKPHLSVIKTICCECIAWKKQIQFRFTIGGSSVVTCKLWEPGAPPPEERIEALRHAFKSGYETSVSMEPMLGDNAEMCRLVKRVSPFVTDTIWLGKLNGAIPLFAQQLPGVKASLRRIREEQSDEKILELHAALRANGKVRWKDSIKKVLRRNGFEI